MCMFRKLYADEIDVRVAQTGKKKDGSGWVQVLLYKDARVDQRVLDETVGPMFWSNSYELIDGHLYCEVTITKDGRCASKQNVGTESNTEREKGEASDAFKRACFNWGIGRELYSAPDIFINLSSDEIIDNGGKVKVRANVKFAVADIGYNKAGEICYLVVTKNGCPCYTFGADNRKPISDENLKSPKMREYLGGRANPIEAAKAAYKLTADQVILLEALLESWNSQR